MRVSHHIYFWGIDIEQLMERKSEHKVGRKADAALD
jgi:hypothetical protein